MGPTLGKEHQVVAISGQSLPAVLQLVGWPHFGLLRVINNVVEAHCYVVDIGRTDREQIRSRINNS